MSERGEIVWTPEPDASAGTHLGRFAAARGFDAYGPLHAWSVREPEAFWGAVADELDLRWRVAPKEVLADASMPGARWFTGGELNHAEHALARAAEAPGEIAVVARSQTRDTQTLTWGELVEQVARCAAGLRRLGVGRGDRVAAYAPNIPETLVAFLATASIGAIWSSCAPEFGTRAVLDRLTQVEPVVLFAVDGYRYGDKRVDRTSEIEALAAALPSVRAVIGIRYLAPGPGPARDDWSTLLTGSDPGAPTFEAVPFDHPLYVLFSSGTTGLPKAIVHGHGGITIEHRKVLSLHHDLGPGEVFSWFTTTGWMMWNYLVSGLTVGARIVLFDGDPGHPSLEVLWDVARETGCTVFGASAPFVMACRKAGLRPDAGSIRQLGSTGAPLPADGFRWVHDTLGDRVQVNSISGGTDVCSAFVGMNPLTPVRAGEISGALLGCAVEAYRSDGSPCPPDELGELVITGPMPSMPVGLWGDTTGERYRAAYFAAFPGVWRHGDWISFTDDGACTITGRSDATLNRGGVRLGTSDFYAVVENLPEIDDSLVVHLDEDDDDRLVLFVALADGAVLDGDLRNRIRAQLRGELSPRHVPDRIEPIPAVPRTLSGKKLEVPVKRILAGAPVDTVASPDTLANPDALDWFTRLR